VNINGDLIYSSNWKMEPLKLSNVNNRLWTTFFVDEHVALAREAREQGEMAWVENNVCVWQ
jgi:hypothetical protein